MMSFESKTDQVLTVVTTSEVRLQLKATDATGVLRTVATTKLVSYGCLE
jgi:hypothetical protein